MPKMIKLSAGVVAAALVGGLLGVQHARADVTPIPVNSTGSCSAGWYVNDDGDENTRKPVQTEDGLKFSGNQLAHHAPEQNITLNNLHPGTFQATPAPSLTDFFSVEIANPDGTGYATLRYDAGEDTWSIGGAIAPAYTGHESNPENFVGKATKWGVIQQTAHVLSFGVGYVRTPATGTETTVKSVTFAGKTYDLTCKPAPFVPSVLKVAAKCRYSKADKRELWTVSNVSGGRSRDFWSWIKSPNPHPGQRPDGWLYLGKHTVAAGKTFNLTTGWGGTLSVHWYDGQGVEKSAWGSSNSKVTCK